MEWHLPQEGETLSQYRYDWMDQFWAANILLATMTDGGTFHGHSQTFLRYWICGTGEVELPTYLPQCWQGCLPLSAMSTPWFAANGTMATLLAVIASTAFCAAANTQRCSVSHTACMTFSFVSYVHKSNCRSSLNTGSVLMFSAVICS